jgi:pilus assembly protein Flp/PilA
MDFLNRLQQWRDARGQDIIEYALLAGFFTVAAGAVFPSVGSSISEIFSVVASQLTKGSAQAS